MQPIENIFQVIAGQRGRFSVAAPNHLRSFRGAMKNHRRQNHDGPQRQESHQTLEKSQTALGIIVLIIIFSGGPRLYQRTGAVCRRTSKEQLDCHLDLMRRKRLPTNAVPYTWLSSCETGRTRVNGGPYESGILVTATHQTFCKIPPLPAQPTTPPITYLLAFIPSIPVSQSTEDLFVTVSRIESCPLRAFCESLLP